MEQGRKQILDTITDKSVLTEISAEIVSAYVSKNPIPATELPDLIRNVHSTIENLSGIGKSTSNSYTKPAVAIKNSITPDYIICLEDGKQFKSLRRHLRSKYNMTPEEYRKKWGLPHDYPMVAPNYAKQRSELAKQMGLGQGR